MKHESATTMDSINSGIVDNCEDIQVEFLHHPFFTPKLKECHHHHNCHIISIDDGFLNRHNQNNNMLQNHKRTNMFSF